MNKTFLRLCILFVVVISMGCVDGQVESEDGDNPGGIPGFVNGNPGGDILGGNGNNNDDDGNDDGNDDTGLTCAEPLLEEGQFIRGDSNVDGRLNIADAVTILTILFASEGPFPCEKAADANSDGEINMADAIFVLNFLFRGGDAPAAPFPDPGFEDAAPEDFVLTCNEDRITKGTHLDGTQSICIPPLNLAADDQFVYLNLETLEEVFPEDPSNSTEWDIAIFSHLTLVNGGVNGSGGVEAAALQDADFGAITQAFPGPYFTDEPSERSDLCGFPGVGFGLGTFVFLTYPLADDDQPEDLCGSGARGPIYVGPWRYSFFLADPFPHTFRARDNVVYSVRAVDGTYYKMQYLSFYRDFNPEIRERVSNFISFRIGAIDAP